MIGVWATEEDAAAHVASRSGLIYFQSGPSKWCVDYAPTAHGVECIAEVIDITVKRASRGSRPLKRAHTHRASVVA